MTKRHPISLKAVSTLAGSAALLLAAVGCADNETSTAKAACAPGASDSTLFYGGTILTMANERKDTTDPYSALLMADGKVIALGTRDDFQDCTVKESVNLEGKTMMPGFIDPHLHLPLMIFFSAMADLSPCLPEPYYYRLYDDDHGTTLCDYTSNTAPVTGLVWTNNRLKDWIKENPGSDWVLGNGIDPSRFGNSKEEIQSTLAFRNAPGNQINAWLVEDGEKADKLKPTFLLDQSGHLAYVNQEAFIEAGICDNTPCGEHNLNPGFSLPQSATPPLGTWVMDESGNFTGLLKEEGAFKPFMDKIASSKKIEALENFASDAKSLETVASILKKIAASGVTTVINGGGFSVGEVKMIKTIAELGPIARTVGLPGLRYRTLMSGTITDKDRPDAKPFEIVAKLREDGIANSEITWEGDGMFGANGIKFWADGSTQGCTAFVRGKYAGHPQNVMGMTQTICEGHYGYESSNYTLSSDANDPYNFTGEGSIYEAMQPFWNDSWMLQVHTNGDGAMLNTLTAFNNLAKQTGDNYDKSLILIHATVGGEHDSANPVANQMAEAIAAGLDLSVSHLAGHIAYWGASMQNSLDGKGQAMDGTIANDDDGRMALQDAARLEQLKDIPVSFHSDAPVSPVNPLWYVQQMVDRKTWVYPTLDTASNYVMPVGPEGAQNVDVYTGLKAVTVVPAMQNRLDDHIGTLKGGMTADLVVLSGNPLELADIPFGIANIAVECSFVGGKVAHKGLGCTSE